MKSTFPKSLKTGEKICFKTVDNAVYDLNGVPLSDRISDIKRNIETNKTNAELANTRINTLLVNNTINDEAVAEELIDMRTGYDSTNYTSAGNAVRGQFLSVFNAIKEITKYTRNAAPNDAGVYDIINLNDAHTELSTDYVNFPYACSVSVPSEYKLNVIVYEYDTDGVSYREVSGVGNSGWVNEYVIPRSVPVVIKLKHSDNSIITKTEIVVLSFTDEYPYELKNDSLTAANFYNSLQYRNEPTETNSDRPITISKLSTDILTLGKPVFVKANPGYQICITRYKQESDGSFTSFHRYDWSDDRFIPIGVPFIFAFTKTDNTMLTFDEFVDNFKVEEIHHDDPVLNGLLNSMTGFGITTENNNSSYELSVTQLSSLELTYDEPTTLYIEEQDDPVVLSYNIIENNNITYDSGWTKSITIPAKVRVKVLFNDDDARSLYDIKRKTQTREHHPFIKDIAQRGFSRYAPENTLIAYEYAALQGFKYVDCNVKFTSDGVPVLLLDYTINRTSNGTGDISTMTFDTVRTYDFGSWFSSSYAGTKIPSFEEFISLCRNKGLHPYIDFGDYNQTYLDTLFNIIDTYGMRRNVTWKSGNIDVLGLINTKDKYARLGLGVNSYDGSPMITDNVILAVNNLRTETNDVFISCNYAHVTNEQVYLCISNLIPLEVWDLTSAEVIREMHPYVSGVSSSFFQAGKYLMDR